MALSRWPVTCQAAYPSAPLPPPSLSISPGRPHAYWSLFLFLRCNFLSQIAACLPLYPYTISCIVLGPAVCVSVCPSCCSKGCDTLSAATAWGGFAPPDQWKGLIKYSRYELHVIGRQGRQKKGGERRVLHTPCLWPLPHPGAALAGLSWRVYALNQDIKCAVARGIHTAISDYLRLGPQITSPH